MVANMVYSTVLMHNINADQQCQAIINTSVWTIFHEEHYYMTAFQFILRKLQQADKTK